MVSLLRGSVSVVESMVHLGSNAASATIGCVTLDKQPGQGLSGSFFLTSSGYKDPLTGA